MLLVPSPKSQLRELMLPSGSVDRLLLKLTVSGAGPEVFDAVKYATGATLAAPAATSKTTVCTSSSPCESVTFRRSVYVPGREVVVLTVFVPEPTG